jgi:anti-anti-sigma regulatory factor
MRTDAMRDLPSLTATVDWSAGVATVTVNGDLDHATCSQLRERLAWLIENRPQRLVLDVGGVPDRCCEQVIAIIAAARRQLPPDCLLDVRSASPAVRAVLGIAGGNGVRVAPAHQAPQPAESGPVR